MLKNESTNWYKIDNAGKMFQAAHQPYSDAVYRIAVNMKEDVKADILERAVNDLRERYPSFFVYVKNGFFWNYFETNKKHFRVQPETAFINQYINPKKNNNYAFAIYYYKNRISLECLHAVTDGYGALEFLKSILYRYLERQGYNVQSEGIVRTKDEKPTYEEVEDCYTKYYTTAKVERQKLPVAYYPKGQKLDNKKGFGVIYGKMDSGQLLSVAKKHNATITQYISALYTYSVVKVHKDKLKGKPISTCIPANVRGLFPSKTLRNFSLAFYCTIYPKEKVTFQEILDLTKQAFAEEMQKDKMQNFLNANVRLEKMWIMRIAPLPIKTFVIQVGKKLIADRKNTRSVSNLGILKLPKSIEEHIIDAECSNTDGMSILTAKNVATISFVRRIKETEIEQYFFKTLAKEGIRIEIQSNLVEEENKPKKKKER